MVTPEKRDMMRRTTTTATIGLALAAAVTLSGCIANPLDQLVEDVVSGGVENLIEDQLGEDVDINVPGEDGSASLPDSWPTTVPTPAGDVIFSAAAEGGFQASILVSDQSVVDDLYADLEAAGYELAGEADLGGLVSRNYTGPDFGIVVGSIADEETGEITVQYILTPVTP